MTDEQENVENKKDEKYKKNEKNGDKTGYYVKQPIFGTGKPSWLKQQIYVSEFIINIRILNNNVKHGG